MDQIQRKRVHQKYKKTNDYKDTNKENKEKIKNAKPILRGDIYWADLNTNEFNSKNSIQNGIRPVLVIQNNKGNLYSTTIIVVPITTKRKFLPTHIPIKNKKLKDSMILAEQITTIPKAKLQKFICTLDNETMKKVDKCLMNSVGLNGKYNSIES